MPLRLRPRVSCPYRGTAGLPYIRLVLFRYFGGIRLDSIVSTDVGKADSWPEIKAVIASRVDNYVLEEDIHPKGSLPTEGAEVTLTSIGLRLEVQ